MIVSNLPTCPPSVTVFKCTWSLLRVTCPATSTPLSPAEHSANPLCLQPVPLPVLAALHMVLRKCTWSIPRVICLPSVTDSMCMWSLPRDTCHSARARRRSCVSPALQPLLGYHLPNIRHFFVPTVLHSTSRHHGNSPVHNHVGYRWLSRPLAYAGQKSRNAPHRPMLTHPLLRSFQRRQVMAQPSAPPQCPKPGK